jgi:hypothetical protein
VSIANIPLLYRIRKPSGEVNTTCPQSCKDFWLKSITFLPVAAGKNLINCYSIYILKMGKIYIKTCKKINNFKK